MSAKHLLTTTSETIVFDDVFYKFFNLTANEIVINNESPLNLDDYTLVIIQENISVLNELDEGEVNAFVRLFNVCHTKTGDVHEIVESHGKEMYLTPELVKLLGIDKKKRKTYEITLSDIPDDTELFLIEIGNSELTKPLYDIMGLLDFKDKRRELNVQNMHDLTQSMLDLCIQSNLSAMAVHAEILLYSLIRSKQNVLKRPDFTKYDAEEDTQLLTVSHALEKHPSVVVGISSQYLDRQLTSPLTIKRTAKSFVDPFFKTKP